MKLLNTSDEATTRCWQWLQSNIRSGLLLTICRAVLERDDEALRAVCTECFAGDYMHSAEHTLGINRELASLGLSEAIRAGYAHSGGGGRNRSGFILICDTQRTILYVMSDFDRQTVGITGQVRDENVPAAHILDALKQALTQSLEMRLGLSQTA